MGHITQKLWGKIDEQELYTYQQKRNASEYF